MLTVNLFPFSGLLRCQAAMDDPDVYRAFLGQTVQVTIDRPLGSRHPRHDFIYTTNYGYIENTRAGDGHEIDAYVLGVAEPIETWSGVCVAVIFRRDDNENKLVVADRPMPESEVRRQTDFVEQHYDISIETVDV